MAGHASWERMEKLLEWGFTHQSLLEEIMHALSSSEADSIFEHIERMHGITEEEEEEQEEEFEEELLSS
jgi:hypothetical protein